MKKNFFFTILLLILFVFAGVSCKSTPKPEEPAPPRPELSVKGTDKNLLDALDKAIDRADAARKRAADFEAPAYFPSDWESAEAEYTAAGGLPRTIDEEIQQAAAAYNAVVDTYDSLFEKTIPLLAQAKEDEIMAARDEFTAARADALMEYLPGADQTALLALNQYEEKDYYAAKDTADKALNTYRTLGTGAKAVLAREEIIKYDFAPNDPENFEKADETGAAAISAYEAGDIDAAGSGAEEALLRYNLVLTAGWASYAAAQGALADTQRNAAMDKKANVAVKDDFEKADSAYTSAADLVKAEKYKEAAAMYVEAEAGFSAASDAADEKRRAAEEAIIEAEKTIEASDETARQAAIIIEGDSK